MKSFDIKFAEWFLRISLSIGMLSAVADRFGLWVKEWSAWGNWQNFVTYTQQLNPWMPSSTIEIVAGLVTFLEIVLAIGLLQNYKTSYIALATAILLFIFGLSMAVFLNIKAPFDYSVFIASAAAFALSKLLKFNHSK